MVQSDLKKILAIVVLDLVFSGAAAAQSRGLQAIKSTDMRAHLEFLSASEFEGRNAPSAALNIASRYLALQAKRIGLKPLLPDGSYLQYVPVEVTTLSAAKSHLKVLLAGGEQVFYFPQSFGVNARMASEGTVSGDVVFLGSLLNRPSDEWNKLVLPDLKGKIVVTLEIPPFAGPAPVTTAAMMPAIARLRFMREKGALAVVTIISPQREKNLAQKGLWFDIPERLRFPDVQTGIPDAPLISSQAQNYQVDIRHDVGASILGLSRAELDAMFALAAQGQPVPAREISGRAFEIGLYFETQQTTTPNVVGWVEGSDTQLKDEYVVIGAHHDHNPTREGRIYPGADDDGSGTVAMLSLAEALLVERPKRSVIFVWNTAEEKGLIGAYYFVQHCPVPVEKISANLNLDMISRNDPDMIYLIGSNKISSELDKSIREMNDRSIRMNLDYTYESLAHPDRFFYRSDQYPYIRYGIPAVWFFCGTTADYHQVTDSLERADLIKAERVTKLVYLICLDIGNKPALLQLDVNPEITTRGAHNMRINWQRQAQTQAKP
jgi:hypothetical protein